MTLNDNLSSAINAKVVYPPRCPSCGRSIVPGTTWKGANYCRGLALLRFIEDDPGLSARELSQRGGVPYTDMTRGFAKHQEYLLVRTETKERQQSGTRYGYWPLGDIEKRQRFVEVTRGLEAVAS